LCRERGLDFVTIDRVLYEFDKEKNGRLQPGKETTRSSHASREPSR
jgi:hypothetical protein